LLSSADRRVAYLQKQILTRLHYALEPGGILFLGKSESQLTNSPQLQCMNTRWRIFQRITDSSLFLSTNSGWLGRYFDLGA